MMARLRALANRIDARTLRERAMLFGATASAIVLLLYSLFLNPLLVTQATLRAQVSQQRNNLAGIDSEIGSVLKAYELDPNAAAHARLAVLQRETAKRSVDLRTMQTGLVAPERIAPLLETILRANGRLQLVSMQTLPASAFGDIGLPLSDAEKPAAAPSAAAGLLYRHGVELTVRGNYLDMVDYLDALEALPTRLFWSGAALEVEQYPNARLSLTVYTLSLDKKWMTL